MKVKITKHFHFHHEIIITFLTLQALSRERLATLEAPKPSVWQLIWYTLTFKILSVSEK